jgi:hypothetical protein
MTTFQKGQINQPGGWCEVDESAPRCIYLGCPACGMPIRFVVTAETVDSVTARDAVVLGLVACPGGNWFEEGPTIQELNP